MQVAVQKVHRPSEENSQLPTFSLIMYDAGDSACDVSRVTTKAPCEASAIHGRHVCKGITGFVLHAFSLQLFTVALIYVLCRRYRLRCFQSNDKSTLQSACHTWQACVQRNHNFRFAHFFAATIYSCTYRALYILQFCDMLSVYNDSHHQRWYSIKYTRKESIASC